MNTRYSRWILCGLVVLGWNHVVFAATGKSISAVKTLAETEQVDRDIPLSRFQQDGKSSVLFQQWTEDDQTAMEVDYSFKYILYNCDYAFNYKTEKREPSCKDDEWKGELYFSFAGRFDFYVDLAGEDYGRASGPVINRISNPALHWRIYPKEGKTPIKNLTLEWFDIGVEHRSNGQVVEIFERDTDPGSPTVGQLLTQIAYDNDDHAYFDGLSRGANYLKLSANFRGGKGRADVNECNHTDQCAMYSLSAKIYATDDSEVNWGQLASKDVSIRDYDIVRLGYTNKFHTFRSKRPSMTVNAEYTFGKDFFGTDSLDIVIARPFETIHGLKWPWYIKIHLGPMSSLSNYSKPANSVGVGFLFTL